ncbi:hypothetical protein CCICO_04550 [Corynebacterium ciconiae DSM 44920]|uniref:hypothetical protein n=1 Tax=Corynebacterium ciconiae TaxID=227319 RepID=UPI0003759F7C|nr:hypothetical protein [Corynebacterium ciconiae]WKD60947.1 hypothetical protein CCICO_04550 [Corynebacterium ciconiae DSM 44920]
MSFLEDIAAALDDAGIESRAHDCTLFVPITSEVEIHFVDIDPDFPAANVYIAAADVDEEDEDFEAVLVAVVFSVDDAVATVDEHIATDQVVTILRDVLDGTDDRLADLDFFQDEDDAHTVRAEVAVNSEIHVCVDLEEGVPTATVDFMALGDDDEAWDDEILSLGSFTDYDRLLDVISLAAEHAEEWEEQLAPIDEDASTGPVPRSALGGLYDTDEEEYFDLDEDDED